MGILGVILGIAAVVCALLGTFLFGTTGAIIAAVLAAAAIVLAFLKRKKDGKGGDKINCTNKNITMYDVVEYKNLVPDAEYRLVATLINKDTKKAITKTEKTFTPDKANGKVNVPLKFNPSKFAGKDLVVFERLYATSDQVKDKEKLFIAGHEDLKDEGQTVHVKKPTSGSDKKGPGKVQTGDTMKLYYLLGGAVVLIGAACVILFKKKRPTEQ